MPSLSDDERMTLHGLEDKAGHLDAEVVVKAASWPKNPLHHLFHWDDQVAAHEQRLDRAQQIIRRVHVNVTTSKITVEVPAYVARIEAVGYVSITKMPKDDRQATIVRELIALRGHALRVGALATAWKNEPVKKWMASLCKWIEGQIE